MVLGKPGEPDLTQISIEVAKRLREEVRIVVLKSGETAKDKESLRAIRHLCAQCDVVGSPAELYEMVMEFDCNRIGELGMCLEAPVVS